MTNNIVSVSNSNITGLYYQKQNNKKTFIDINSKNRSKIIEHFNLQKFRTIREFNFYSLNEEENINYHYQAKSLMNGIKKKS